MNGILELSQLSTAPAQRSHLKAVLRQSIQAALMVTATLPPDQQVAEMRSWLLAIQQQCAAMAKTFIVVEEAITCNQYQLGGTEQDTATLFRGPSETASVAICVTRKGSLLHRNDSPWQIYRHAGDVNPAPTPFG